jgi:hypothetical protein
LPKLTSSSHFTVTNCNAVVWQFACSFSNMLKILHSVRHTILSENRDTSCSIRTYSLSLGNVCIILGISYKLRNPICHTTYTQLHNTLIWHLPSFRSLSYYFLSPLPCLNYWDVKLQIIKGCHNSQLTRCINHYECHPWKFEDLDNFRWIELEKSQIRGSANHQGKWAKILLTGVRWTQSQQTSSYLAY